MAFFDEASIPFKERWSGVLRDDEDDTFIETIGIIAAVVVSFPLFLDTIDRDDLFCPIDYYIPYSLVYLLLPAFAIFTVCLALLVQRVKRRAYPLFSAVEFFEKYKSIIAFSVVAFFSTLGFSFVRGSYYACLIVGSKASYEDKNHTLAFEDAFGNKEGLSRMMGVCFLTVPVIFFAIVSFFEPCWSLKLEQRALYRLFVRSRDRFSSMFMGNNLKSVAANDAYCRVSCLIQEVERLKESCSNGSNDSCVMEIIGKYLQLEYGTRLKCNEILRNSVSTDSVIGMLMLEEQLLAKFASEDFLKEFKEKKDA